METQQSKLCSTRQRTCKRINFVGGLILLLLPVVVLADVCSYEREVFYSLSGVALEQLSVDAQAGSLSVHGTETGDDIVVKARLCSSRKGELDEMDVSHSRRDGVEYLETVIPDLHNFLWVSGYAYIDLDVSIPAGLAVTVKDGSGAIQITGSGDLRIDDGSGEISVINVGGNLSIQDGSGDINVEDVEGDVDIEDGSGHMRIARVGGKVSISDGSGNIEVYDVDQEVVISEDGSGNIDLRRVNSSVNIGNDGSGNLTVDTVSGNLTVRHKGSGDTDYRNVEGDIFLP